MTHLPHIRTHPTPPHPCIPTHPYTYPPMFVMLLHKHPPHPTHASLHISPNVCHVTSNHPPHPHIPTHIPQCLLCDFTPPTHTFPHIPIHIPQCLSCYFTPPTQPTHPIPPTPSNASLHISPNLCHVTSHHPPHPTDAFQCIPTHIPQCLSCNFTPPTTPHHPPTHPTHPCLSTHPYTYPPMFVM